jgi:tripartite-type tricarboxylate transporter receptor subunit TctC
LPPAIALVREGKVRALAVTGPTRAQSFPDLPTVAEAALPGYEAVLHYGIVAPAGTPRAIVDKINGEIVRVLQLPEVRERLAAEAFELPADTPDQFAAIIKGEMSRWAKLVKETGARIE